MERKFSSSQQSKKCLWVQISDQDYRESGNLNHNYLSGRISETQIRRDFPPTSRSRQHTNFWRIQFLLRLRLSGCTKRSKMNSKSLSWVWWRTLHDDENSFKMCVNEKKSENGRLFPNDKFYFNFSVYTWTFNGKKSMKYELLFL